MSQCVPVAFTRISTEIGYGFQIRDELGLLSPYGRVLISDVENDKFQLGMQLTMGTGMEIEFIGTRALERRGESDVGLGVEGHLRW